MDYVANVTRADVLRVVERDFPAAQRDEVLAALGGYVDPRGEAAAARVHLAVLKLSDGRADAVRTHVDIARIDFRDVLTAAEYPGFARVGFVGIDGMTPDSVEALKERDWQQYEQWLKRS